MDERQRAYRAARAAWRAEVEAWLREREAVLPGTPRTLLHRGKFD